MDGLFVNLLPRPVRFLRQVGNFESSRDFSMASIQTERSINDFSRTATRQQGCSAWPDVGREPIPRLLEIAKKGEVSVLIGTGRESGLTNNASISTAIRIISV